MLTSNTSSAHLLAHTPRSNGGLHQNFYFKILSFTRLGLFLLKEFQVQSRSLTFDNQEIESDRNSVRENHLQAGLSRWPVGCANEQNLRLPTSSVLVYTTSQPQRLCGPVPLGFSFYGAFQYRQSRSELRGRKEKNNYFCVDGRRQEVADWLVSRARSRSGVSRCRSGKA